MPPQHRALRYHASVPPGTRTGAGGSALAADVAHQPSRGSRTTIDGGLLASPCSFHSYAPNSPKKLGVPVALWLTTSTPRST